MAENKRIETHPAWEDGLGFALGIAIVLTPVLTADPVDYALQIATTFIGLIILVAALEERLQVLVKEEEPSREWEEGLQALAGAMLIALPFVFGYAASGTLRFWHFALGAIVIVLAIHELWNDWGAHEQEMARRGL